MIKMIKEVRNYIDEFDPEPLELENLFQINLENGDYFTITSKMVSEASPSKVIDRYGFGYEAEYFWFFYDVAAFQAGRLMIFDAEKKALVFDYFDEAFCITSFGYNVTNDSFLGVTSYHLPMTPKTFPDQYFYIGKDRVLKWPFEPPTK